jgi:hypothetical protein
MAFQECQRLLIELVNVLIDRGVCTALEHEEIGVLDRRAERASKAG